MTVIALANMKGGVGKTTLCVNLAFELFRSRGEKVLIVDNDPQFNATSSLLTPDVYINGCLKNKNQSTIYNIYEKRPRIHGQKSTKNDPKTFFMRTWYMTKDRKIRLDIIPSQIELYETLRNPSQKEYLLDKFLKRNASEYDYIFIDCPPTPSVLTLSAFAASDYVIIPVTPSYYATLGLPQFLGTLRDFKDDLIDDHNITPLGVIYTNVQRPATGATVKRAMRQVEEALSEFSDDVPIFEATMSHLKVYEKTLWQSKPVHKITGRGIRGRSEATAELRDIANELIKKIEDRRGFKNGRP
jgi:chromosome partitioning protein